MKIEKGISEKYQHFLDYLKNIEGKSSKSITVYKTYSDIANYEYSNCTKKQLLDIIYDLEPSSKSTVNSILNIFKLYGEFINCKELSNVAYSMSSSESWEEIVKRGITKPQFISHQQFEEIINKIKTNKYLSLNTLYYQTLIQCVYEGIWNNDLSYLENLKEEDIDNVNNVIALRSNDNIDSPFYLNVSSELINNLNILSYQNEWKRENMNDSVAKIPIQGKFNTSCFKIEQRRKRSEKNTTEYNIIYRRKLREITFKTIGYHLTYKQLFISGLMYRIKLKFDMQGLDFRDTFNTKRNKNHKAVEIIKSELSRVNYNAEIKQLRKLVDGYIDIFI